MDKNRIQKFLSSTRVLQFVFFVAAVTLVTYFFPREGKFRYTFQEGKPWKYGLLTAPFDFPVYKDEAVIQQERDSIMLDSSKTMSRAKYRYPNCNLHGKPTKTCSINSPTPTRIIFYKPVT